MMKKDRRWTKLNKNMRMCTEKEDEKWKFFSFKDEGHISTVAETALSVLTTIQTPLTDYYSVKDVANNVRKKMKMLKMENLMMNCWQVQNASFNKCSSRASGKYFFFLLLLWKPDIKYSMSLEIDFTIHIFTTWQ